MLTPEEVQYPAFAGPPKGGSGELADAADDQEGVLAAPAPEASGEVPARRLVVPENTKGWSYSRLFADVVRGAREIVITDPEVRELHQMRNLMEFLTMVHDLVPVGDEAQVRLVSRADEVRQAEQEDSLGRIAGAFAGTRVAFSSTLAAEAVGVARITTDTGWTVDVDRGLDLFQRFEPGPFSVEQAIQEARLVRGAVLTYSRARTRPE